MSNHQYFEDKIAWITGGSSGIGEAIAKELAVMCAKVIISSHEKEELLRVKNEITGVKYEPEILSFDLSDPESVEKAAGQLLAASKVPDFFFSNGGISQRATAIETDIDIDRRIMEINYFSGIIITKKILPAMVKKGGGHFVVTSSISGKFGFPLRSAYAASKHALHGFYESLWTEMWNQGIRTTIICPGRVKTNISLHALGKDGKKHAEMDAGQAGGISPEMAARRILSAVRQNKREAYVGGKEILMARIKQYLPALFYRVVRKIKPK